MKKILCLCLVFAFCIGLVACSQSSRMKLEITDDSMAPTFSSGDTVVVEAVDPNDLAVGDIIAFWAVIDGQRMIVVHRITNIYDGGNFLAFSTKGDNNSQDDPSNVHESDIVGRYIRKAIFGSF